LKGMHTSMVTFVTDSEGVALTRAEVIDRLCQYDVYLIMKNIDLQDYNWLSDMRQHGFVGYEHYSAEELKAEWQESEDGYRSMIADGEQLYDIHSTKETA
jgi:hypothetical protein